MHGLKSTPAMDGKHGIIPDTILNTMVITVMVRHMYL